MLDEDFGEESGHFVVDPGFTSLVLCFDVAIFKSGVERTPKRQRGLLACEYAAAHLRVFVFAVASVGRLDKAAVVDEETAINEGEWGKVGGHL